MEKTKGILDNNKDKRKILLARHGATDLNDNGDSIRGWLNVPLNDHGIEEAYELGEKLKKEDFDIIICSDLKRAVETAQIISDITGKPIEGKTDLLRPWDVGELTGKESKTVIPRMMEYVNKHPDEKVPEGESFNNFKKRFLGGIEKIIESFPSKTILFVAHHRNDRLLNAWIADGCPSNGDFNHEIFNTKGMPPAEYETLFIKEKK